MKLTRPLLLMGVFLPTLSASLQADQTRDFTKPLEGDKRILHALNRIAFGPRPGDVGRIRQMGLSTWIEQQLHPETIDDSSLQSRLAVFKTLRMSGQELVLAQLNDTGGILKKIKKAQAQNVAVKPAQEKKLMMLEEADIEKQTSLQAIGEMQNDKIARAIDSNRQLYEVMVDFWSNHFNIDVKKNLARSLKIQDEREVIRPHVFGKFRDLLEASATSPAMLVYLDNATSTVEFELTARQLERLKQRNDKLLPTNQPAQQPDPNAALNPAPTKKRGGLNENYAREIMELHTLGVDGGYTQKDVTEVARCFTGWGIDRESGKFRFRPIAHDNGEKMVLGQRIPSGGGIQDGEKVLDILAAHPSTAKFIARKLCTRLVADEPPASLIDKAAKTFTSTSGDLRAVVKTIVTSSEFFSQGAYRAKIKSPFEYCVSSIRSMGGTVLIPNPEERTDRLMLIGDGASSVRQNGKYQRQGKKSVALYIAGMGQPLYSYQAPTGYTETSTEWVSAGALVSRLNYALDLTANSVSNVIATPTLLLKGVNEHDREAIIGRLFDELLGGDVSAGTRGTVLREAGADAFIDRQKLAALILGSPEFQRR